MATHEREKADEKVVEEGWGLIKNVLTSQEGWGRIEPGINKMKQALEGETLESSEQFSQEKYMLIYTTVYTMCANNNVKNDFSEQLYVRYRGFLEDYMNSTVLPAVQAKHAGEYLLRELVKRWGVHKTMVRWLSNMFSYLNRFYVAHNELPTLREVGVSCFRDLVYAEMKVDVKDAVIALINSEREGEHIDRALLKNALDIFAEMGVECYKSDFESFMVEDTGVFYRRKASSWIQEDSCPDYMMKAEACLKREKERIGHYLHASSEEKVVKMVHQELLIQKKNQILEKEHSGCLILIRDEKVDDLSRMYRLFSKIEEGLEPIVAIFKQHVTEEGVALVKQAEDEISKKKDRGGVQEHAFIQKIIDLHDKYLQNVIECFMDHHLFCKALKEAFEVFCNKSVAGNTSGELLALYCDNLLKKGGGEKLNDDQIENMLEKVMKILAFTSDKDLFAEFCRKKLARRLLFGYTASVDHERSLLIKLKQLCGGQYTSKMEGMLTDITLVVENQANFEEYLTMSTNLKLSIDLNMTVLNFLQWPNYKTSALALPAEMEKCVTIYNEFYKTSKNKRKLSWIYSLGTCNIIGKFDARPIELIVTTYQAALLLLFNGEDKLSYNDIKNQLNLPDEDVARLLNSMSCAKYKILNKSPPTKEIKQIDSFEFNAKFTNKMRRIKIPLPPVDERKKVRDDVLKERPYVVDATIVRIMKSRNQLPFQQLITECVEQISHMFKPDIKVIKYQVDSLINREYLERDRNNPNLLNYLA